MLLEVRREMAHSYTLEISRYLSAQNWSRLHKVVDSRSYQELRDPFDLPVDCNESSQLAFTFLGIKTLSRQNALNLFPFAKQTRQLRLKCRCRKDNRHRIGPT